MQSFIIDITTKDKNKCIRRMSKLKGYENVKDGGMYHQDIMYSQIHLDSVKTLDEIENWFYKSNLDYVGVIEVSN